MIDAIPAYIPDLFVPAEIREVQPDSASILQQRMEEIERILCHDSLISTVIDEDTAWIALSDDVDPDLSSLYINGVPFEGDRIELESGYEYVLGYELRNACGDLLASAEKLLQSDCSDQQTNIHQPADQQLFSPDGSADLADETSQQSLTGKELSPSADLMGENGFWQDQDDSQKPNHLDSDQNNQNEDSFGELLQPGDASSQNGGSADLNLNPDHDPAKQNASDNPDQSENPDFSDHPRQQDQSELDLSDQQDQRDLWSLMQHTESQDPDGAGQDGNLSALEMDPRPQQKSFDDETGSDPNDPREENSADDLSYSDQSLSGQSEQQKPDGSLDSDPSEPTSGDHKPDSVENIPQDNAADNKNTDNKNADDQESDQKENAGNDLPDQTASIHLPVQISTDRLKDTTQKADQQLSKADQVSAALKTKTDLFDESAQLSEKQADKSAVTSNLQHSVSSRQKIDAGMNQQDQQTKSSEMQPDYQGQNSLLKIQPNSADAAVSQSDSSLQKDLFQTAAAKEPANEKQQGSENQSSGSSLANSSPVWMRFPEMNASNLQEQSDAQEASVLLQKQTQPASQSISQGLSADLLQSADFFEESAQSFTPARSTAVSSMGSLPFAASSPSSADAGPSAKSAGFAAKNNTVPPSAASVQAASGSQTQNAAGTIKESYEKHVPVMTAVPTGSESKSVTTQTNQSRKETETASQTSLSSEMKTDLKENSVPRSGSNTSGSLQEARILQPSLTDSSRSETGVQASSSLSIAGKTRTSTWSLSSSGNLTQQESVYSTKPAAVYTKSAGNPESIHPGEEVRLYLNVDEEDASVFINGKPAALNYQVDEMGQTYMPLKAGMEAMNIRVTQNGTDYEWQYSLRPETGKLFSIPALQAVSGLLMTGWFWLKRRLV